MYHWIIGDVFSAYVPVCLEYTADIHAHTFTYAILRSSEGSAYLYVCDCISVCISMQHTCFIQRWSLRACCALAVRLQCGRHTFAARSLDCTSRRAVVERSPRGQRMHMCRHFANFIRIGSITVAGCNKRASVAHCRLNWCLGIVDCQWFMSHLPSRAGAVMAIEQFQSRKSHSILQIRN